MTIIVKLKCYEPMNKNFKNKRMKLNKFFGALNKTFIC